CWTNQSRTAFRVPWKHNARKDITSSDLEVFKAWAKASGRYEGCPEDPAKWKTNFRCALASTGMFELLEDHSKRGDDPHKVFGITPGEPDPVRGCVGVEGWLALNPQEVAALEIPLSGSTDPAQSLMLEEVDMLQGVLQYCNISPRDSSALDPSWATIGDTPQQDALLQPAVFQQLVSTLEQSPLGAYRPPAPMLQGEVQGGCCGASRRGTVPLLCPQPEVTVPVLAPGEAVLLDPATSPAPPEGNTDGIISNLDILQVSIFYRGRLFHQEEVVKGGQCLLAYQPSDPALVQRPGCLVRFPSPTELPDSKQRHFTEKLLCSAGLQLEQRALKIFATRLKKCKVFWALSQQLEGVEDPPCNVLDRDQETPIFDFDEFCTELRDFRNGQRQRSPDFTIYLCFGQCFSSAKPKESKLILVKLVPKFCEFWYEQVLREGASSLDSGTISLQLSDSFSLFELIEQYSMQLD
ncbi:IRF3 factor, partial [Chloroceryle aenea]|nr:IRF3 factor [Chloroceryle aenea]